MNAVTDPRTWSTEALAQHVAREYAEDLEACRYGDDHEERVNTLVELAMEPQYFDDFENVGEPLLSGDILDLITDSASDAARAYQGRAISAQQSFLP